MTTYPKSIFCVVDDLLLKMQMGGKSALKVLENQNCPGIFPVIVMDIDMPLMDGISISMPTGKKILSSRIFFLMGKS